jgi:hypothetical protein
MYTALQGDIMSDLTPEQEARNAEYDAEMAEHAAQADRDIDMMMEELEASYDPEADDGLIDARWNYSTEFWDTTGDGGREAVWDAMSEDEKAAGTAEYVEKHIKDGVWFRWSDGTIHNKVERWYIWTDGTVRAVKQTERNNPIMEFKAELQKEADRWEEFESGVRLEAHNIMESMDEYITEQRESGILPPVNNKVDVENAFWVSVVYPEAVVNAGGIMKPRYNSWDALTHTERKTKAEALVESNLAAGIWFRWSDGEIYRVAEDAVEEAVPEREYADEEWEVTDLNFFLWMDTIFPNGAEKIEGFMPLYDVWDAMSESDKEKNGELLIQRNLDQGIWFRWSDGKIYEKPEK